MYFSKHIYIYFFHRPPNINTVEFVVIIILSFLLSTVTEKILQKKYTEKLQELPMVMW